MNGYQELECKPELMIRGIQDAKFKPLKVLKLTLNMGDLKIDSKKFKAALFSMTNLNYLKLYNINDKNY